MKHAAAVVSRLLEDESDFQDEIEALPAPAKPTVTRIDTWYDEAGDPYQHFTHEPVTMALDEFDIEDGRTLPDLVVKHLVDEGACFASSSHFHPGVWYDGQSHLEHNDGSQQSSWHLKGFSPEDEEAIFKLMMGR